MAKINQFRYIFTIYLLIYCNSRVNVSGSTGLFSPSESYVKQQQKQNCQTTVWNEKDEDESVIQCYLSASSSDGGEEKQFHVQGWRWHTLSLVRDAERLESLAQRLASLSPSSNNGKALRKGVSHVLDFNYKGLRRVESELFLPWLREKLLFDNNNNNNNNNNNKESISTPTTSKDINHAFQNMLKRLETERNQIEDIAEAMKKQLEIVTKLSDDDHDDDELSSMAETHYLSATRNIAQLSADLSDCVRNMMEKQDTYIVPAVASIVPEKEQHSFNNKVIRKLGILDSRIHLVGMYDAVWNLNDEKERELFQESIPAIPRYMIPRWKKSLYLPQTDVLDESYPLS